MNAYTQFLGRDGSRFLKDGMVFIVVLVTSFFSLAASEAPALPSPVISGIWLDRTQITVQVDVPAGLRTVVLESRAGERDGAWAPRAVRRIAASAVKTGSRELFQVPNRREFEWLRAVARESDPLPSNFYTGTNQFRGAVSQSQLPVFNGNTGNGDVLAPGAGAEDGTGSTPRSVVESDIWKVDGDRVYFYNQYRGLQVIDVSNPDSARITGELALAASGEQMYVLPDSHPVLLVTAGCYDPTASAGAWIIDARESQPKVVSKVSVEGYLVESRLVGEVLYIASQVYRSYTEGSQTRYEMGTVLTSFDLQNPGAPEKRSTLFFPGYGNVVSATDRFFFVVTQQPADWSRSVVHVVDITSASGEMAEYVTIQPQGYVKDKFKLDCQGTRFTCISERWGNVRNTVLETFRLEDPRSASKFTVAKSGELTLGQNETLFATRFDGDKVYLVTFLRIDPLWIVDLSDPVKPRIAGELLVPGWSTYIYPWGDRLVAVGTESNRVAVSLFNVSNPAKPALAGRELLGNSYSWSESAWNEKAVTIAPESGIILVPFSGDTANGYASRVQLVDLSRDSIQKRGVIEHAMAPRRTAIVQNRVLSISSRELLTVDISQRDLPRVTSDLELSWGVSRLFVAGQHLLELQEDSSYSATRLRASVRSVPTSDPNRTVSRLELSARNIVGTAFRDGFLYVLQTTPGYGVMLQTGEEGDLSRARSVLSIVDAHDPTRLVLVSQVVVATADSDTYLTFQPLWVKEDLLVWAGMGGLGYWRWGGPWYAGGAVTDAIAPGWGWGWGWGSSGGVLIAVRVSDRTHPVVESRIQLQGRAGTEGMNFGYLEAFTARGLVFTSHGESKVFDTPVDPTLPDRPARGDTAVNVTVPIIPIQRWVQNEFLDVVDYATPSKPLIRDPVPLPSTLKGISHDGGVLYTLGAELNSTGETTGNNRLTVLAYDDVEVHEVTAQSFKGYSEVSLLVHPSGLLVSRVQQSDDGKTTQPILERYRLTDQGELVRRSGLSTATSLSQLTARGDLFAASDYSGVVRLYDLSSVDNISEIGDVKQATCAWGNLLYGDGRLDAGFWIPLGDFGVRHVPLRN